MAKKRIKLPAAIMALIAGIMVGGAREIIVPEGVRPGSTIAIVTPGSAVDSCVIDSVVVSLRSKGYQAKVMPHAYGSEYGTYAASDSLRAADLMTAFTDPEVDAILCSRGGYGCVRLLPMLDGEVIRTHPKWLVGYSDISDLHAFMTTQAGVASIHGPMAGHIVSEADSNAATAHLFTLLREGLPKQYTIEPEAYNNPGSAKGMLVGGNLISINGLSETPYDVLNISDTGDTGGIILFIEDTEEKIYAIERIMMRLEQSGILGRVKGLIIGRFTDYGTSDDFVDIDAMLHHWLRQWGYYEGEKSIPIVFNFPVGHVSDNYPLVCGATVTLDVSADGTVLTMLR